MFEKRKEIVSQSGRVMLFIFFAASMDNVNIPSKFDSLPEKDAIVEKVEGKGGSAAAVVCKLLKEIQLKELNKYFEKSVLGVVALLGTVQNNKLSRYQTYFDSCV